MAGPVAPGWTPLPRLQPLYDEVVQLRPAVPLTVTVGDPAAGLLPAQLAGKAREALLVERIEGTGPAGVRYRRDQTLVAVFPLDQLNALRADLGLPLQEFLDRHHVYFAMER